jgi:hypothetical protein
MYVISLSAIPSRFGALEPTLQSLLSQEVRPEAVRLYIPQRYRRFPDWDGTLPDVPRGVEIRRTEEDLGPATKALFAADELRGQDVRLLFCDDDRLYLPEWSTRILGAAEAHPEAAIVTAGFHLSDMGRDWLKQRPRPRASLGYFGKQGDLRYQLERLKLGLVQRRRRLRLHEKPPRNYIQRSGYVDVGEGFGGFLIRPEWLGRDSWDIPAVMWTVDDVWISGQLARHGVPIWAEAFASRFLTTSLQKLDALCMSVIDGADRQQANRACAIYMRDTYGVWGGTRPRL